MTYIPHLFRLKDPALIERWKRLAEHVRKIPPGSGITVYVNVLDREWEVAARRSTRTPSAVFFTKVRTGDIEATENLKAGEEFHGITVDYKVDEKAPFILRHLSATHLRVNDDGLELASDGKVGYIRLLIRSLREWNTGMMIPDTAELDELLEHLEHATSHTREDG